MRGSILLFAVAAAAQTPQEIFSSRVLPMLRKDCFGCHGDGQTMAKLDLRSREATLRGGTRGPALIPGNAAQSLLYQAIAGGGALEMPPGGETKRLSAETTAAVKRWIDGGAPWAEEPTKEWTFKPEDLWAFRPLPPPGKAATIDSLLNTKAAPRAGRRTLLRRVTFDLTGLPPTPEESAAFERDSSPNAFAKVVDRLLASPRYGERWGRHWLDVVRYADTNGYSNDFERPNAWRYRDYVIRAFNHDKPYDRFIREQIAGDELFPGDAEALIATGFLRAGPWEHTGMSVEAVTRQMFLDDVTAATSNTFLGLTAGCARCHDHKFDPIPQRDYYRLQAVFATTEFARPKLPFLDTENTADLAEGAAHMKTIAARNQERMDRFKKPDGKVDDTLEGEQYEEFKLFQKHGQLYKESLDRYEPKAFAVSSGPWDGATDGGPNLRYPAKSAYRAPPMHVLAGGNITAPGESVDPGVLSAVERYSGFAAPAIPTTVAGRRAALANWIADARNPLTARVMVNRVWQYHFGTALAADPNNLGKMGKKPTHAALLDWLAARFIESGWSVKALHREILASAAYQRAGFPARRLEAEALRDSILAVAGELSPAAGGPGVFPEINEDLARQPQHRMGSLAPAYQPSATRSQRNRRTVYTFQQRSLADPMIEVFNGAGMDLSCERRESSTVAPQAFALFNSRFAHDMALAMAARAERESSNARGRVERLFRLAYQRAPERAELAEALTHLERQTAYYQSHPAAPRPPKTPLVHTITSELTGAHVRFVHDPDPAPYEPNLHPSDVPPATRALAGLALAILNSNEFVYVY